MIRSFACRETALIWTGKRSRKLPSDIQASALRKLRMLNQARVLEDLRVPPGNRLEALKGDREGQHSIRINDQWRICFRLGPMRGQRRRHRRLSLRQDDQLPNLHPGEILIEEFLKPMGISQNPVAREIDVAPRRINELVLGKRAVTADTALRLARYFGVSEGFWWAAGRLRPDGEAARDRADLAAIAPGPLNDIECDDE